MRTYKIKKSMAVLLCTALLAAGMLGGCSHTVSDSLSKEDGSVEAENTQTVEDAAKVEEAQLQAEEAAESAQEVLSDSSDAGEYTAVVTLNGSSADIEGNGAAADGSQIIISQEGTYLISGTLNDGRIVVDAQGEDVVLVLRGASISCSYSCPVFLYKSSSTTIVLEENTVSTLSDSTSYDYSDSYSSADNNEPNACLYSKSDLMITGNGQLNINAAFNNGITGKDTLQIVYATVNVSAANNGITGKDCVILSGTSVSVDCNGNGIASSNDTDDTLGYITVTDSCVNVNCTEDGMDAQTTLSISGSTVDITTSGTTAASAKGLKADSILINSGTFTISTTDDSIHSQGDVSIFGGSFTLSSGDDAIHGNDSVTISSGEITIAESYEGIEGTLVNITGGTISVNASDDGINAAGGADQSGFEGGFEGGFGDSFSSTSASINISGGITTINSDGDGVDSNGSLNVTGGELYVSGPTSSGNGAIDYQTTGIISGGTVVAAGSSGMAMNFGSTSTQGSILVSLSGNAGDTITLTASDGSILVSFTAEKRFESIVISCPGLAVGETYTVSTSSSSTSITLTSLIYGGSGTGGMMPQGGMNPGGMGQGGMGQPGGNQSGGMQPAQSGGGGQPGGSGQPGGGMNSGRMGSGEM